MAGGVRDVRHPRLVHDHAETRRDCGDEARVATDQTRGEKGGEREGTIAARDQQGGGGAQGSRRGEEQDRVQVRLTVAAG